MSVKNIFLKILKSRKKVIKQREDDLNKFKLYIEKEWSFLKDYGLELNYNSFNDAVFSTKDNRFHFIINYNDIYKYRRIDKHDFYKTLSTNSVKEFLADMLEFI